MKRRNVKQPTVSVKAANGSESANYKVMWMRWSLPLLALSIFSAQIIITSFE